MTDSLPGYRTYEVPGAFIVDLDAQGWAISKRPAVMYVHVDCGALCPDRAAVDAHTRWHLQIADRIAAARHGSRPHYG